MKTDFRRLPEFLLAVLLIITVILLPSCSEPDENSDKLSVVASVYPMYDFACKIAGGEADVSLLVPAGSEPHDWEPRTSDIAKIENADIFIYSGAELEHWVEDVLNSILNKNLIIVNASAKIELLEHDSGADPHVWLDPKNALAQLTEIHSAFMKKAPGTSVYTDNYEKYKAEFEKLDTEFRILDDVKNKNLVTVHSAFGYLCEAYGLTPISVLGVSPEGEPSAARMAEIADFVRDNGVKTVFYESDDSKKIASTVAKEANASTAFLNPIEAQISDNEDYFSIMRDNLELLKSALN